MNMMYGAAKVSVWWDIENCPVPRDCNANSTARNINSALVNLGYHGPISISAYGDTNRIPNPIQKALSSTGISLNHIPAGAKDASDKKILVDMLFWAVDNPAPANYLLISGDTDFSNALHQLSMRRYNILLAQPFQRCSQSLLAAAKIIWHWPTLSAGGSPHHIAKPTPPLPPQQNNNTAIQPPPANFFFKAPHQFFSGNHPIAPSSTPNLPSNQDSYKTIAHDSSHYSTSSQNQSFSAPVLMNMPKLNLNEYTDNVANTSSIDHQKTGEDSGPNTGSGPRPAGNDYLNQRQALIDVILRALYALKYEKVVPTERNITACIRYGDPRCRTVDVRKALDFAIEQHSVEKRTLGALHLYVGKNEELWEFVNHIGGDTTDFPQTTWDKIKQFLSSSGRSSILASRCRYEASLILRRSCVAELLLGDVLKIMEMIITVKEWIKVHHQSGWLPITITLTESGG